MTSGTSVAPDQSPLPQRLLSKAITDLVDQAFAYVDLEVNQQHQIFHAGIVWGASTHDYAQDAIASAVQRLETLQREHHVGFCGHNFRRFDAPHLIDAFPQFHPRKIIDTLELSVLAFPRRTHHRLAKDYKLSEFAANDPVQDALGTRALLHNCLTALSQLPPSLFRAYVWLLTCGQTPEDEAYKFLFSALHTAADVPPAVADLPPSAVRSMTQYNLRAFLTHARSESFEMRLCIAGLLAWNHALMGKPSDSPATSPNNDLVPPWLSHLASYPTAMERLKHISSREPELQSYREQFIEHPFRHPQQAAIQAILDRASPVVIMPTGGGKSLVYQLQDGAHGSDKAPIPTRRRSPWL